MTLEFRRALRAEELAARFTLCEVVRQRARQLEGGARPRLYAPGQKLLRVALQETLHGLVTFVSLPALPVVAPEGSGR